jgi:hypothetical protein
MPGEDEARASVECVLAAEFARLDSAIALAIRLLVANKSIDVGPSRMSRKSAGVVLGLFAKAIKTARGIRMLASASLAEDGMVLCRTLLETTVAILYITQRSTLRRTDEYLAHILMRTRKVMEAWAKTRGLKRHAKRITAKVGVHLAPYDYLGADRLKLLRGSYSGSTIEQTFRKTGLRRLYQTSYRLLTGHQHVADVASHVTFTDGGGIALMAGSSDPGAMRLLLFWTHQFLWAAMQRVSERAGLGYEAEIERQKPPRDRSRTMLLAWSKRQKSRAAAASKTAR